MSRGTAQSAHVSTFSDENVFIETPRNRTPVCLIEFIFNFTVPLSLHISISDPPDRYQIGKKTF